MKRKKRELSFSKAQGAKSRSLSEEANAKPGCTIDYPYFLHELGMGVGEGKLIRARGELCTDTWVVIVLFWSCFPYLRFLLSEARAVIMAKTEYTCKVHAHIRGCNFTNEPGWGYFQHTQTF